MVTSSQRERIQSRTFALTQVTAGVADVFYDSLFEMAPEARALFPDDMKTQHAKLMDMVSLIICYLDEGGNLAEEIKDLGGRHYGYGMSADAFELGKFAFLTAIKSTIRNWEPEDSAAWSALLDEVIDLMRQGYRAREAEVALQESA